MLRFDIVSEVNDLVFENPITVRVYLYLMDKDEVGIRETQRALDIGSPSTASWHLNILVEKGIAEKLPSNTSSDYGRPFGEVFKSYDYDFFKVDPMLFSPAKVIVTNANTGKSFTAGELNKALLTTSFGL